MSKEEAENVMAKVNKKRKKEKTQYETKVDLSNAFKELREMNKEALRILNNR
jgi:hypothetical protein